MTCGDQNRSHEQICQRTDDGPASVGPRRKPIALDPGPQGSGRRSPSTSFRRDLRKKSIRLRVLKNSLARRVFSDMGMDGLSKYLEGPSAVAWGGEGITELAKEITAQVKTLKKPEIKGGAVDGVVVGPEQVDDITKLPSREVLIGQVIGLLAGAGATDAGALVVAVVHPGRPARSPRQSGRSAKAATEPQPPAEAG